MTSGGCLVREGTRNAWYRLFNYLQFPVILAVTFLFIRYSYGYSTHPGAHVAVSTALIDAVLIRMWKRWNIMNIGSVVVLNVFAAGVILFGSDPLELKVSSWYVLCALFITLTNISCTPTRRQEVRE